jgi:SAM-dependent methyltransferase
VATFERNRGDVRVFRRSNRLAYIIHELPRRLEDLSRDLHCPSDGRVLDYGCADMPYRRFFPPSVQYLAADLPGNLEATIMIDADGTVPVDDVSVDAVLSTQVLEHVADPALYLRECARVLRPGGRLLLSTHGFMVYHPDPVDFWRWTSAGLREEVSRAGLDVVRFEGIMGLSATGLQLFQDAIMYRVSARLHPAIAFVTQSLIALVDRGEPASTRDTNALVFGLVAEKPTLGTSRLTA